MPLFDMSRISFLTLHIVVSNIIDFSFEWTIYTKTLSELRGSSSRKQCILSYIKIANETKSVILHINKTHGYQEIPGKSRQEYVFKQDSK